MKYLIPVLVGGAAITAGVTTTIAQAHGALNGHASLRPYWPGYGAAGALLATAGIIAIIATSQEKQPRGQKEVGLKLAALMREEVELRDRLIHAPNQQQFLKLVAESDKWISRTFALLNEAGFPTDAERFSQVRNRAPVQKEVDEFRHVADWKQHTVIVLAMHRSELDQIMSNRRL